METVAADVGRIVEVGGAMGLVHLNISKCELITHKDEAISDSLLQSFTRVDIADASLLGAPLFHGPALDTARKKCCDDLALAAERLRDIGSQDALLLLRSSFGAPKVLHHLRCALSVSHEALEVFDRCLRDAIQHIHVTNSNLSDIQWLRASLPVKDGGLGVRRVSSLAIPAYVASAASTLPLQVESLGPANESAVDFLTTLENKIAQQAGDEGQTAFLFQRLSVLVQRFNCVLLHDSFVDDDCRD